METIINNPQGNLLFLLKQQWNWIFFTHKEVFKKSCPVQIECLSDLCEPITITGSNLNSSCKLTIKIRSPSCIYYFNEIKPIIIISINEFFKSKIINDIHLIASNI
jgi:hypothetical protein